MTIVLIDSPELRLTLDPVRTEDTVPSVAFDVTAQLMMPFQTATLLIKECWFSHDELNAFEGALLIMLGEHDGTAQLANLSEKTILQFTKEGDELRTVFTMADTIGMAETTLKLNGYASEAHQIHSNLSSYEKWW